MKKIFENLTKWQNYAHYLVLTIALVVMFHLMGIHSFHTSQFFPNLNFVKLFVGLIVIDTIVHMTFYALPKPYRWRD